jgi:hypothetical protein
VLGVEIKIRIYFSRLRDASCALAWALGLALLAAPRPAAAQLKAAFEAQLLSPGAAAAGFGRSVAISGEVAVVGAPGAENDTLSIGHAYVYRLGESGWEFAAELTSSTISSGDEFAISIAIDGDTIVVGSWRDDSIATNSGSAFVYVEPPGGWAESVSPSATLVPSDAAISDRFGHAVGISGETIVVGAPGWGATPDNRGTAYVFERPGGGWSGAVAESARLAASDSESLDEHGWAVAIDGDTIVATNYVDDYGGEGSGAGYVYVEPSGGWSSAASPVLEHAKLDDADVDAIDFLGWSVDVSGDTVVMGAPFDATVGGSVAGFVFVEPEGGWAGNVTHAAKLQGTGPNEQFEIAVAIAGEAVVMGVAVHAAPAFNAGVGYLFLEPEGGWTGNLNESLKWSAPDTDVSDQLGYAVALSGNRVLLGAPGDATPSSGTGTASVFSLPLAPCVTDPDPLCGAEAVPALGGPLWLALALLAAAAAVQARRSL